MNTVLKTLVALGLGLTATACTESKRERNATTFGDRPADITCWSFGNEIFNGRSTGKVTREDGMLGFVDAASGRYTTLNGECRVIYLAKKN